MEKEKIHNNEIESSNKILNSAKKNAGNTNKIMTINKDRNNSLNKLSSNVDNKNAKNITRTKSSEGKMIKYSINHQ